MKEVRVCEAMKSLVGTLSDGTVLHQQDGGTESRQVRVCAAKRSGAMKAPVGLLSDGTVLRSKMEGPSPDLGEKQSDAGRSRSLFRHWYQQAA